MSEIDAGKLGFATREAFNRHNMLFGWWRGRLSLQPEEEGLFKLNVGRTSSIHLVNPNRWRRYRWGIARQLRRLAHTYGATDYAALFPGSTVLDIGANIGEFSLYAHSKGARVVAIEPDQMTLRALQRNLSQTSIPIVEKALWSEQKTLTWHSAAIHADSSLIAGPTTDTSYAVYACTLDEIASELNIDSILFIKADAEGAEPEVLSGARETLKRTRFIALDCGPERQGHDTVDACRQILELEDFDARVLPRRRTIVFAENRRLR